MPDDKKLAPSHTPEWKRAYYATHREQWQAYNRKYYLANKEKVRDTNKKYASENREALLKYQKENYLANRDAILERNRQHYHNNKELHQKWNGKYRKTAVGKYSAYKRAANGRKIEFKLSFDEFASFWGKPCAYCGDPIKTIGLDRMDSAAGYEVGNVVPCCSHCNYGKRTLAPYEYIEHCRKVALMNPCEARYLA
jgi:hypothetical protein